MHKFYGQFNPPVDQFIFERYFPDPNIKGVFVECGAFDGLIECSCKFFEETMGWKGFNLEPAPANFRELKRNRPHSNNFEIGLSDFDGNIEFRHVISPLLGENFGNGSIAHTANHLSDLEGRGCSFQDIFIKVTTWRCFVEAQNLSYVDLLVLDVEGHELSVIEGMRGCDVLPDIVCIEVGHLDFGEIRKRLGGLGYTYDVSSYVNAFFVKTEKLPLFALRRAVTTVTSKPDETGVPPLVAEISTSLPERSDVHAALLEENLHLKRRVEELTWLHQEMVSSKVWKFVEQLRKWRR